MAGVTTSTAKQRYVFFPYVPKRSWKTDYQGAAASATASSKASPTAMAQLKDFSRYKFDSYFIPFKSFKGITVAFSEHMKYVRYIP